jgi:Tol biopolymer transport system component
MSSNIRNIGFILLSLCALMACGKDKTIQPSVNHAPDAPFNPSPAHNATRVGISGVMLRWHCADPDGDTIKYNVYFDTLSDPALVASSQLDSTYQVDSLEFSRDYYWKVVAKDEHDSATASPVWHFTTMPGPEQITFDSDRFNNYRIMLMNADGSNVRNIIDSSGMGDGHPSFSNDGSKIVFWHFIGNSVRINTINCDGSARFEVTHENLYTGPPVWSPNMNQIAFLVSTDTGNYLSALYIVDANGENLHVIKDDIPQESWKISWSPDGSRIAFENDSVGYINCSIYTINTDGTNLQRLTSNINYDRDPAWSHDGTKIAFSRRVVTENIRTDQIFVMNSDGSNQHNITNTLTYERVPCWSPDDNQIAFASNRDGNLEIYVMNADGSNQRNITNNPASDFDPSWAPWHR